MRSCIKLLTVNTVLGMRRRVDIDEIRRENLRAEAAARGGPAALAKLLGGMSDSQMSQIIGKNPTRSIGDQLARKIEEQLELPPYHLDMMESPYGELIDEIAAELAKRDEDAQQEILRIIRRIPEDPRRAEAVAAGHPTPMQAGAEH